MAPNRSQHRVHAVERGVQTNGDERVLKVTFGLWKRVCARGTLSNTISVGMCIPPKRYRYQNVQRSPLCGLRNASVKVSARAKTRLLFRPLASPSCRQICITSSSENTLPNGYRENISTQSRSLKYRDLQPRRQL